MGGNDTMHSSTFLSLRTIFLAVACNDAFTSDNCWKYGGKFAARWFFWGDHREIKIQLESTYSFSGLSSCLTAPGDKDLFVWEDTELKGFLHKSHTGSNVAWVFLLFGIYLRDSFDVRLISSMERGFWVIRLFISTTYSWPKMQVGDVWSLDTEGCWTFFKLASVED